MNRVWTLYLEINRCLFSFWGIPDHIFALIHLPHLFKNKLFQLLVQNNSLTFTTQREFVQDGSCLHLTWFLKQPCITASFLPAFDLLPASGFLRPIPSRLSWLYSELIHEEKVFSSSSSPLSLPLSVLLLAPCYPASFSFVIQSIMLRKLKGSNGILMWMHRRVAFKSNVGSFDYYWFYFLLNTRRNRSYVQVGLWQCWVDGLPIFCSVLAYLHF